MGAKTPYADEMTDMSYSSDDYYVPMASAPVGPGAAVIMICFVMHALSVYCYRYHSSRNGPHYITSIADNVVNDEHHFDNEYDNDNEHQLEVSAAIAPTNAVVLAQISPYRVNPAYRRPGGDSDHGYSTMTPHEDSELAGPTYNEPLLVGRDRTRLIETTANYSDATASSRASSHSLKGLTLLKHSSKPLPQTILEVEVTNNLTAQVQVYNMVVVVVVDTQ